jgi:hypothetical protein
MCLRNSDLCTYLSTVYFFLILYVSTVTSDVRDTVDLTHSCSSETKLLQGYQEHKHPSRFRNFPFINEVNINSITY